MKKSLIALAALATVATAAQAQSSVTLYGIMDAGVVKSTASGGQGSETELFSGGSASSRFGLRGTEDLGGGLNAGFVLEADVSTATGVAGGTTYNGTTAASGTLFSRQAFMNIGSKDVGTVSLGRFNRLDYSLAAAYDAFGGGNIVGLVRSGYLGQKDYYNMTPSDRPDARYSQAIQYVSPTFNGLTLQLQRAMGGAAGSSSASSASAYALTYTYGNLSAAVSLHDDKTSTGTDRSKTKGYFAAYDFGVAKVMIADMEKTIAGSDTKPRLTFVGVTAPVNAKIKVMATAGSIKDSQNNASTAVAGANADVWGVGFDYAFSKRTSAYIHHGSVNNNSLSVNYVSSALQPGAAGRDAKSTGVGIRHSF
jgi:predicted porin